MVFITNDATAKMLMSLKENDGKTALANIALMYAELLSVLTPEQLAESYSLNGLLILTKLVQRLNNIDDNGCRRNSESN